MLPEQRHQYILSALNRSGALSVAELVHELGVSRETIRRDLNALAARQLLIMTHGGALAPDRREPTLSERQASNADAKQLIGERAAQFVPDGTSVLLDSGSTTYAVALALTARRRLAVYTNDWRIAFLLARRNENRVTLLGGELSDDEDATFGLDTIQQLAQYRVDFCFVGAGGISSNGELTDYSRLAAEVRSRMLAAASTPIVVADHSKFGRATPVRINGFGMARCLITDRAPDAGLQRALADQSIELIVCG